jgi:hypothetical protein
MTDSTTTPNGSAKLTERSKARRSQLLGLLVVAICATVAARVALWSGDALGEAAVWGAIIGLVLARGDRRRDLSRLLDRSGVIGSTVDTPPPHTIIQP